MQSKCKLQNRGDSDLRIICVLAVQEIVTFERKVPTMSSANAQQGVLQGTESQLNIHCCENENDLKGPGTVRRGS